MCTKIGLSQFFYIIKIFQLMLGKILYLFSFKLKDRNMSNNLLEHFLFECCLVYVHHFYPKFRIGRIKNWSNIVLIVHELKRTVSLKKGKEKKKNYPSISL